jgi:polysaccharide export outer membrane protein
MRPFILRVVFLLLCLSSLGNSAFAEELSGAAAETSSSESSTNYKIGPENALQLDIYYGKGEKISQKVRVSAGGFIQCPLIGDVEVGGLTVSEAQAKLRQLLEKDYLVNPQVTIFIEEYSTVSIVGEVKTPGVYPIKGRLTVVELISLAEGFSKIAAPNKVKVVRTHADGTKEEITVRVKDIMNKRSGDQEDVPLVSGDLVIVPESFL